MIWSNNCPDRQSRYQQHITETLVHSASRTRRHARCLQRVVLPSRYFVLGRDTALSAPKKGNKPPRSKAEVSWNGEVTAREVAKKSKAHQLQVSDNVVRVSPASPYV